MPGWVVLTSHFRRYYFVVEEDNTPLSVTVTPCDAPLEWKLTLQELPEEASGEGSGIIDTRQPWKRLMTRIAIHYAPLNDAVMLGLVLWRVLIKS